MLESCSFASLLPCTALFGVVAINDVSDGVACIVLCADHHMSSPCRNSLLCMQFEGAVWSCRLQHQLQLYLWQQHIESTVAAPLVPQLRSSVSHTEGQPSQQTLAQIRLAHAFLCKGAERGLCTMTQERVL